MEQDLTLLHRLVWFDDHETLNAVLSDLNESSPDTKKLLINAQFRGLAPIHLAIQLGHSASVHVLVQHGADMLSGTELGFLPLQEATSLGDRDMIRELLLKRSDQIRDYIYQRQPELHRVVTEDIDDLYLEMNWNFKSWVPFFAMLCPNDCYKIWKKGNKLRIDSTLLGLGKLKWVRGNLSYLFVIEKEASHFYILDHDKRLWQHVKKLKPMDEREIEEDLNTRLNQEIVMGKVDSRRPVNFSRARSIMGLGEERVERVGGGGDGFVARVYAVENLEWLTRTRKEHLRDRPEGDLSKQTSSWFLGYGGRTAISHIQQQQQQQQQPIEENDSTETLYKESIEEIKEALGSGADAEMNNHLADFDPHQIDSLLDDSQKLAQIHTPSLAPPANRKQVPFEEYFPPRGMSSEEQAALPYIHMGRPLTMTHQRKQLSASLWMSDQFPLRLEQLLPLFEIMSPSNEHFDKLREFISMNLPPGFPVQAEIPLLMILSARITFGNFKWWTKETRAEIPIPSAADPTVSSKHWFEIPEGYTEGIVMDSIFKKGE